MTNEQKMKIADFRYSGASYRAIATALGMTESSVKTYCSRNNLTDRDMALQERENGNHCPQCGAVLEKAKGRKPRRFCSDKCRYTWWNSHRLLKPKTSGKKIRCNHCGKEFMQYGKENRKYCCHNCYVAARYGQKGQTSRTGTV